MGISKKDIASLLRRLQRIVLCINQYSIRILYKPGSILFVAYWLSRCNHETNRDKEISDTSITINAIESCTDIPDCMTTEDIRLASLEDEHLDMLSEYVSQG